MATHPGGLTAEPAVQVTGLVRSHGGRRVLDGLDLRIAPGEFVALLGRSGSGKSTLLRALARLDHAGTDSGDLRTAERVSLAFQDARLLPWLRVLGNVVLGLRGGNAQERGRAALTEVGLAGREQAWPHELSGGEQQRASLARSLVRKPRLLLADEPFGALDALTRGRMHELLRALHARHRPAVLLVTHDVDEAVTLADRVLVLDGGKIAVDLTLDPPRPRTAHRPGAARYRALLLDALGITPGSPDLPAAEGARALSDDHPTDATPDDTLPGGPR